MFDKLRRARADIATMNLLFPAAERIARDDGIDEPGAEHLLLSALELDDGIATKALHEVGIEPADLRAAIIGQHDEALRSIGVVADDNAIAAALPTPDRPSGLYRAQGSMQTAFTRAVELAKSEKAALCSGYLLLSVTEAEHGAVARSLEHLGVDRELLRATTRRLLAAID